MRAKRYNSVANRAYYAAFQAAVGALIHSDIRAEAKKTWQHRFVLSQFSGKLVKRRKRLPGDLPGRFAELLRLRLEADYAPGDVGGRDAEQCVRDATRILSEVERMTRLQTLSEARAEYEARVADGEAAVALGEERVLEVQNTIRERYPEAKFDIWRTGPKDYRLNVYLPRSSFGRISRRLSNRLIDILVDDDIWIVAIPSPLRELKDSAD